MSDGTQLNPGSAGDVIATEDMGAYKVPVSKIRIGAADVDGGDVTIANPFPIAISSGAAQTGTSTNPLPVQVTGLDPDGATIRTPTVERTNAVNELHVADTRVIAALDELRIAVSQLLDQMTSGTINVTSTPIALDASNRQVAVGPAASGAAVALAGNPQVFAGSDGAFVRTLRTDAMGALQIAGVGSVGAAAPAVAELSAGADPMNLTRAIATDARGVVLVNAQDVIGRLDQLITQQSELLLLLSCALGASGNASNTGSNSI